MPAGDPPPLDWRELPITCQAGGSGGYATSKGTRGCSFQSSWAITYAGTSTWGGKFWNRYALCGTHKNAAVRDQPGFWTVERIERP